MSIHVSKRGDRDEELEEALEMLDVEFLLDSAGLDYKVTHGRSGTQVNLKECMHCGNDKWKAYANADTGLGKCFVCEKGINKWWMVKAGNPMLNGRETVETIKRLAKDQGWRPKRKHAVEVADEVELLLPESHVLPIRGKNLKYLETRGITADIAKYFSLRFSKSGVFNYMDKGKSRVQSYENRIIIPVFDLAGELVSFQGRDITGLAEKKYLFPPGFASTGAHLYNGQNALGAERIVVGEGAFDVYGLKMALDGEMALRDVVPVGSFGKHLSYGNEDSQLAKLLYLKQYGLKQITFMWDGEKKAILDAIDAALMVRRYGFQVRVAILPDGKDPNEVSPDVVRRAFWQAQVIDTANAARLKVLVAARCAA